MKVLAINGSPHTKGNTAFALGEMADEFTRIGAEMGIDGGIETEIVHLGGKVIRGCLACGACARNRNERCIVDGDPVNETIQKMIAADAIVLASPVHYAGIGGTMKSFCDRAFYVAAANGGLLVGKPGAAVVAVRRTGGSAAWQGLNYYLTISGMPVAGSTYWSVVHGHAPGEAAQDAEGLQTVRNAARSIAAMLRQRQVAEAAGLEGSVCEFDRTARTNFVR